MSGGRVRYRFGPLERRGLIAGWRGGQIAAVAVGAVVAVVVLGRHANAVTILAAVSLVVSCVAFAWWPIAGRTAEQWAPTVVRWCVGVPGRRRSGRPGVESLGHCVGPDGRPCAVVDAAPRRERARQGGRRGEAGARRLVRGAVRMPAAVRRGPFGGLEILESGVEDEGLMGVVVDRRLSTYTAVVSVLGQSFALLGPEEKERRVTSWSGVLASLGRERSVVHRLQWIASTVPDDGAAVDGHLLSASVLGPDEPARRSYEALLRVAGTETCRHEVHVALQVRASGAAGRAMRSLGGGDAAACAVLGREVGALRRQLAAADVSVECVLDARGVASVVRRAIDPTPPGSRRCPPCGVSWPWPVAVEEEWGALRADGSWHATYWIAEWPRTDVGPEFLAPMLLGSARRAVAVVMEPLSPARAVRQAERARTADIADAELRRRGGFLATARRTREAELAVRREEELADGHASVRFSGYVTVSAVSRAQLARACDATEQAASQCRLELRRLFGDQARAFTCALPLGRGLS